MTQVFSNAHHTATDIAECVYIFPVYAGVSVVGFECHINDRTLKGVVQEKREARKIFNTAVAQGQTAGLLEQVPESSDVFATRLGNVSKGSVVEVRIEYVGELKHDAGVGGVRWTLPMVVAPRYGDMPRVFGERAVMKQGGRGVEVVVDVEVEEGKWVVGVESPSHLFGVSLGRVSAIGEGEEPCMRKASARLVTGEGSVAELEKDVVLIVRMKDNGMPTAVLETHPTIPNQRALMVDLVPKFDLPQAKPEIIFVADRSGSMRGSRMTSLVAALRVFLKSLPVGVKFNICSFGDRHSFLWKRSRMYDAETLQEAMTHVTSFGADFGGTKTYEAVVAAMDSRYGDIDTEILLLTDGEIWDHEDLVKHLNVHCEKDIRVFALGVGHNVSHAMIEGAARAGKGFAQTVVEGEKMDKKVVRMLKGALSPHISDYRMEVNYEETDDLGWQVVEKVPYSLENLAVGGVKEEPVKEFRKISLYDPSVKLDEGEAVIEERDLDVDRYATLPQIKLPKLLQTPHDMPPLYPHNRTNMYLLISPETVQKTPKSVVLKGISPHGPLELEIPVQILETRGTAIHQLAAKKAMQELEEGCGWIYDARPGTTARFYDLHPSLFDEIIQREAIRLGTTFQVAGKWCSFVAVSEENERGQISESQPADTQTITTASLSDFGVECMPEAYEEGSDDDVGFGLFEEPDSRERPGLEAFQDSEAHQPEIQGLYGCVFRELSAVSRANDTPEDGHIKKANLSLSDWERVHAIIARQTFEGSWEYDPKLPSLLNLDESELMMKEQEEKRLIWVTLLVVAFLENKMAAEQEIWDLVVEKAKSWLATCGIDFDSPWGLDAWAQDVVKSSE
ncbi:MAG: hypothetical protein Q9164_003710 [Protoblastenia rupestris]